MQKIIGVIIVSICLLACDNKQTKAESITVNKALAQKYYEHFNNHNFVAMAAMYTDTAAFKDPSLGQGIVKQTRQQTIDKYTALVKQFPNLHDEVLQTYTSDNNHIIVEFITKGTGEDNSKFELPVCTIFTISNGYITNDYTYYNNF